MSSARIWGVGDIAHPRGFGSCVEPAATRIDPTTVQKNIVLTTTVFSDYTISGLDRRGQQVVTALVRLRERYIRALA